MARRPKKAMNTGEWLNTYADMVTLLLCFFVLMFSMSTINAENWKQIVNSLNPNAVVVNTPGIVEGEAEGENPPVPELTDEDVAFEELYEILSSYVAGNNLQDMIEMEKVDGMIFIVFRNNIFFDGDSFVLRQEGRDILDAFAGALDGLNDIVGEIRVLGHTTQKDPVIPNNIGPDRFLASNRATVVTVYLQEKGIIDGKKIVPLGYGQQYPVASFDTEENRAKNRRVEMLIMQNDKINQALENVYAEFGFEGYDGSGE